MKVLHCISNLQVGGVPRQVVDQLPLIVKSDSTIQHGLIAFKTGELEETTKFMSTNNDISLFILHRKYRFSLSFIIRLMKAVSEFNPDIIHCYNGTPSLWLRLIYRKKRNFKIICHYGGLGNLGTIWSRIIEQYLLRFTDFCIFNSISTQRIYNYRLKIPCKQNVIYNGIPIHSDSQLNNDHPFHNESRPFNILSVCRVSPIKALDTCILAVHDLLNRNFKINYTIVGTGSSLARLQMLVNDLKINHSVFFAGLQLNVHEFYKKSDLFLVTSYNETFCLSLCEAMYHRLVCIAGNVGGPSEIITNEHDGYLIPMTEPIDKKTLKQIQPLVFNGSEKRIMEPRRISSKSLADMIEQIINNYNNLTNLRENARNKVLSKFTADRYSNEIVENYHLLLKV